MQENEYRHISDLIWGPPVVICVNSVKNDFTSHLKGYWEVLCSVAYGAVSDK